ncbi:MAG: ABC transporter permease [Rhizobiaceae bacterium]|nr:ABC transporter permease [Rhizobiaceae bacterium]
MLRYTIQRMGLGFLICLVAMTVLFSVVFVIPGDPAAIALGPRATPEMKELLRQRMGLDQPLFMQLFYFISKSLTGDLGVDVWSGRPISTIVGEALGFTLALIAAGLGWAVLFGVPLGYLSAVRRGSLFDRISGVLSIAMIAIPAFVVAIYSLLTFAVWLRWLPALGAGEPGNFSDQLVHLVLPAFAIGLGWVGYLSRLVRASVLEVLAENHVRTARAFGMPERIVVTQYVLRSAILPVITLLGLAIGSMLSNAVFAEIVFNRPGVGKLAFDAAMARNYPIVMGTTLVTVTLFIFANILADLLVATVDPRVRSRL